MERLQPQEAPAFNQQLVGKRVEVLWKYSLPDGSSQLIWATGRVARVADGLTDTKTKRGKALCPAGAVLWAWDWEADPEYDEPAGEKWLFLLPKRWNKHVQYAWRFDPCHLSAVSCAHAPRVENAASDDEYLTDDGCVCDE